MEELDLTYKRQFTSTEKLYVAHGLMSPPCVSQIVFEGTGVLDKDQWQTAIRRAGDANPGSRLVIKGSLAMSHWMDSGRAPGLREVDGSAWSGMNQEGSAFLDTVLCPFEGPTCEVVLVHGDPLRIVFRAHHAVMDGRGMMNWIIDMFRTLREEPMIGHPSTMTEYRLARSFQNKGRTPAPHQYPAITGFTDHKESGFSWQRIHVSGPIRDVLPKIALILAREIWSTNPGGLVRLAIPVDMRQRDSRIRSTGNLSNLIYLDVAQNDTLETLSQNIKLQLAEKNDGMLYWADSLVRYMPLSMIQRSLKDEVQAKQTSGLYRNSGIISNMGSIPVQYFSGGGFNTTEIFGIPIHMDYLPFFSGVCQTGNQVNFMMGMSNKLASHDRLTAVMQKIASRLPREQ